MNLIAAVDKHWAIGNKGQMLVTIPKDQTLFREETIGKVVVMGRKTFESLPGGQPLYGRKNIVMTRDPEYKPKGTIVCNSLEEVMNELKQYKSEEIFIGGGQQIYEQFLPFCNVAHVTYVDYEYHADTYFPNLDKQAGWKLALESEEETYFDLCYTFRMYRKD